MFKLFISLLIAAILPQEATVEWKAALSEDNGATQLVLTGEVRDGYYTHPMDAHGLATTLEVDTTGGIELIGAPTEEYTPSEYKGEKVVIGTYIIKQMLKMDNSVSEVSGTVTWGSCHGDECGMPEDFEFSVPVLSEAAPVEDGGSGKSGLLALILEAIAWGLVMLLTPCVFPMVPMTVSFFIKGSDSPAAGRFKALMYGLFIILLYTVPICLIIGITWMAGGAAVTADIFNWIATHWLPNILFFVIFMIFAASFFGAFEIVLPSGWTNSADRKSDSKGLVGVFFLALTLVLVSFSCTGPIVGTVLIKSTRGEFWAPMITMLAFSTAFALPFTLLAFFPSLIKKLPKSGGWLNSVKVTLGFIELALGLKFLSTADQTYHWHLLDREIYLAIWIVCFTLLGFYLLGKIKFKNDSEVKYISFKRLVLVILDFTFVLYLIPGMWGAPLKALSGYLPPLETQDFVLGSNLQSSVQVKNAPGTIAMPHGLTGYTDLNDALEEAGRTGKNIFVDITGHGCVNCREMESRVWSDPAVLQLLRDDFVIAALYVDDKVRLPESKWVTTEDGKVLKDVGRVNSHIALERFKANAQPNYFILSPSGEIVAGPRGYNLDIDGFVNFLTGPEAGNAVQETE